MRNFQGRFGKQRSGYSSFMLQGASTELGQACVTTLFTILLLTQGGIFLTHPQLATLSCDRSNSNLGICKLMLSSLLGKKVVPFPLTQLEGAEVKHHGKLRQLVLLLPDGKLHFPVNHGFSDTEGKAAQINAFLQNSEIQSLSLRQDSRWATYPMGLTMTGFGSCLIWSYISNLLKRFSSRSDL
ncbi:hypothetical protein NDA01_09505 [Trichocoleus desertorum AS-A10]|uniref:hypothetical protein n=1 Tax=Trichocoleus desertorum TaxID=1481672 RepID=UPI003299DC55